MNKYLLIYLIIFIIIFSNCLISKKINNNKTKRLFSENKMYSIILPEDWKKISTSNILQIVNNDESTVMSSTLFFIGDLSFEDFSSVRFRSVDVELWKEINFDKYDFKSNYPMKTKIYSYKNKNEKMLYIVNCIKYKKLYYLSMTFIVDLEKLDIEYKNINSILYSLKFN